MSPELPDAGLPETGLSDAGLPDAGLPDTTRPRSTWVLRSVTALLLAAAAAILVGVFAPYLSPRWKLLLIYPAALAATVGWMTAVLFRWARLHRTTLVVGAAVPIVALMLATYYAISLRLHRIDRATEVELNLKAQPGGALIWNDLQSGRKPANEIEADFLSAYRDIYDARRSEPLDAYLQARLSSVSRQGVSVVWARGITTVECLVAVAVGAMVARLSMCGAERRP